MTRLIGSPQKTLRLRPTSELTELDFFAAAALTGLMAEHREPDPDDYYPKLAFDSAALMVEEAARRRELERQKESIVTDN